MPKEQLGGKIKEHVRNHTNGQAIDRSIIHCVQILLYFMSNARSRSHQLLLLLLLLRQQCCLSLYATLC